MSDTTKTYYLKLSPELSRELRHRAIETGRTMNAEIVDALRRYLDDSKKASEAPAVERTDA